MAIQDDIIQNIVLGGVQDVVSGFQSMQRAGTEAFNSISRAALGSQSALGAFATAAAGLAATTGILAVGMFAWVKSSSQGIIAMGNFAEETSTTIQELSTFSTALSRVGSDTGNLTNAIRRLAVRVETDWGIIQKSVREASNTATRDMLSVARAELEVGKSSREAARAEQEAANERIRASLNVKEAKQNLLQAQQALDRFEGVAPPSRRDQIEQERSRLTLARDQARQQQREARQRKENQAEEEAAKIAEKQLDSQLKQLQLNEALQKQREDQANSIVELKKFIDDLASGAEADSSRVNITMDNMIRGIIASVGLAGTSLQDFKGSLSDAASTAPRLFAVFEKISAVMANTKDETLKTAIAVAAFGRGVDPTLIHALSKGPEALAALRQTMKDLGLVIDEVELKIARDFRASLGGLRTTVDIISKQFSNLFAPSFTLLLDAARAGFEKLRVPLLEFGAALVEKIQPAIESFVRVLAGVPDQVQDKWLLDLISNVVQLGSAFEIVAGVIGGAASLIGSALQVIAGTFNLITGASVSAGQAATAILLIAVAFSVLLGVLRLIIAPLVLFSTTIIGTMVPALIAAAPAIAAMAAGFGVVLLAYRAATNFMQRKEFEKSLEGIQKQMKEGGASAEEIADTTNKMWKNFQDSQKGVVDDLKGLWQGLTGVTNEWVDAAKKSAEEAAAGNEEAAKKTIEEWRKAGEQSAKKFQEEFEKSQKAAESKAGQTANNIANKLGQGIKTGLAKVGAEAAKKVTDSEIVIKQVGDTQKYFDALKKLIQARKELADLESQGAAGADEEQQRKIAAKRAEVADLEKEVRRARNNLGDIADSIRDITSKESHPAVRTLEDTKKALNATNQTKTATDSVRQAMESKNTVLQKQNTLENDRSGIKVIENKTKATQDLIKENQKLTKDYSTPVTPRKAETKVGTTGDLAEPFSFKKGKARVEEEKRIQKEINDAAKKGIEERKKTEEQVVQPKGGTDPRVDNEKKTQDTITDVDKKGVEIRRQTKAADTKESLDQEKKYVEGFIRELEQGLRSTDVKRRSMAASEIGFQKLRLEELKALEKAQTDEEKKAVNERFNAQREALTSRENLRTQEFENRKKSNAQQQQEAEDARKRLEETVKKSSAEREAASEADRLIKLGQLADEGRGKIDQLNQTPLDILPKNIEEAKKAAEGLEPAFDKIKTRFEELQDDFRQPIKPEVDTEVLDIIKQKIEEINKSKEKLEEIPLPQPRPPGALPGDEPLGIDPDANRAAIESIEDLGTSIDQAKGKFAALTTAGTNTANDISGSFGELNQKLEETPRAIDDAIKSMKGTDIPSIEIQVTPEFQELEKFKKQIQDLENLKPEIEPEVKPDEAEQGLKQIASTAQQSASAVEAAFRDVDVSSGIENSAQQAERALENIEIPRIETPEVNFQPVVDEAQQAGQQAGSELEQGLETIFFDASPIIVAFEQLQSAASQSATTMNSAFDAVNFGSDIQSETTQAISALTQLESRARATAAAVDDISSGGGNDGGNGFVGMAHGGLFRGRSGVDRNIIRISDFEYIMKPEAVRRYGTHFMDLINSLQFRGFRAGGLVRIPSYATGGPTSGGGGSSRQQSRTMNLTIGGQTFKGLTAPEDTAKQLERAAVGSQLKSTGAKPRWRR